MQVSIASPYWSYYPGQEAVLTDELAQTWHECGHCKIVGDAEETTEQTHDDAVETTDAQEAPERVGDTDGQSDNTTSDGTTDTGDGEAAPKGRRNR